MDGHEWEDVMEYRNKMVFLPALKEFEKHMAKYERFDLDLEGRESDIFQLWKKANKELSFNIMMSAASMSMMMPGTCGELVHYIQGILRAKFKPG